MRRRVGENLPLRLPDEILQALDGLATRRGTTRAEVARRILADGIMAEAARDALPLLRQAVPQMIRPEIRQEAKLLSEQIRELRRLILHSIRLGAQSVYFGAKLTPAQERSQVIGEARAAAERRIKEILGHDAEDE